MRDTVGRDVGTRWAGVQGRELEEWVSQGVRSELKHWGKVGWGYVDRGAAGSGTGS